MSSPLPGRRCSRGTLDDLDILRGAAAASDGVIHLAFKHDIAFSGDFQGAADADRRAVETIRRGAGGLRSTVPHRLRDARGWRRVAWRPNGTGAVPTRAVAALAGGPQTRLATAQFTLSLASRGVRSSVVRLPPTCHGDGDNGFMATLVAIARDKGVSGYIGDGSNRWPAMHRIDVAHLFRLALEKAPAGSTLHAVAEEGVPIRQVAEVIGRHLDLPVVCRLPRGRRRALRVPCRLPRGRQPGLERTDPRAAGMAADPSRAHRRSRPRPLFPRPNRTMTRALPS